MLEFTVNSLLEKELDGRKYLVAPVTLLVEGVHVGLSGDKVYYPANEIESGRASWNGAPITLGHPHINMQPTSANTPEVLETFGLGRIFNVIASEGKSRGEAWIDIQKAEQIAPGLIELIRSGSEIEVSVGIIYDADFTSGNWNGEAFEWIAREYELDHLALLPNDEGACSLLDGCGIRFNIANSPKSKVVRVEKAAANQNSIIQGFGAWILRKLGLQQAMSYSEKEQEAAEALRAAPEYSGKGIWIREMYEDHVIYEVTEGEGYGVGEEKIFSRAYAVDADGNISFGSEITEVKRKVTYVAVSAENLIAKVTKEETVSKEQKVDALIACECTKFGAQDRDWLMTLPEEKLALLQVEEPKEEPKDEAVASGEAPPVAAGEAPVVKDHPEPEPKPDQNLAAPKPATLEELIAGAPPELRDTITRAVQREKEEKAQLIEGLKSNPRNKFSAEWLAARSVEELESLSLLGDANSDFSGNAGGRSGSAGEDVPVAWDVSAGKAAK